MPNLQPMCQHNKYSTSDAGAGGSKTNLQSDVVVQYCNHPYAPYQSDVTRGSYL